MARLRKGLIAILMLFTSCSGLEHTEQENLRRANAKGEFIHRNHGEVHYALTIPPQKVREHYPWEEAYAGKYPKITKDFFRCKGSSSNPPHADYKDPTRPANYFDCGGFQKHSLPLQNGKEFVYPVLIDLLNYVQTKTGCRAIVTCGHRCPVHNVYADPTPVNQSSKHMMGAEVDFYVQGLEGRPEEVVQLLMQYFHESTNYRSQKEYQVFERLPKSDLITPPWYNKEVLIKLYTKNEGRDFDNRHPFPYISLQVRFDREQNEKVTCSYQKAFNNYKRY